MSGSRFENSGNRIAERIARLPPEKRALFRRQLAGARSSQILERRDRNQIENIPLSFAQQRLWFLEQMEGELTAYNMPLAWRLHGRLNVDALQHALEAIVQRQESLRTTFAMTADGPVQVIQDIARFKLSLEDLSSTVPHQQDMELADRRYLEAGRPFDLGTDLMLRGTLLRLGEDDQVLLLTMHHIASDGWSRQLLYRELGELYEAFSGDRAPQLPALPVQYVDYTLWQRAQLQGDRLESLLGYWRDKLNGLAALEMLTDRPRPVVLSHQGAQYDFELDEGLVGSLQTLCQRQELTLQMLLLAAFQVLLSRYSGQEDIAVGVPTAGRNDGALENLIGFFVNTLVLRTDMSGDPTFKELLGRVREVSLAAYDHQELPFEKLVEELHPERQLNRNPLVQVMFQLVSSFNQQLALADLSTTPLTQESERVRFDLELHLRQQQARLFGMIVYSTDLFDAPTIERMVGHFTCLLQSIVANPDQKVSELTLLTDAERHQLLVEWNDTATDYPHDQCAHELFEQQVAQTPDAIAVVFDDQLLTYRELDERANQLARYLIAQGVTPLDTVGLFVERSIEMLVGIYGVLKSGGVYLPLDPDYPQDRILFMIEESETSVLLTQGSIRSRLPDCRTTVLCLDSEWETVARESKDRVEHRTTSEHLAYIIYTSGSTGNPKGVMNSHRGIVNHTRWLQDVYPLTAADRVMQKTPFSFDVSLYEFFWPLAFGATLVIAKPEGHKDVNYLIDLIESQRITVMHFVASMLAAFLSSKALDRCAGIKLVLTSGEALPLEVQASYFARMQAPLLDVYGPTETAVHVTYHFCERETTRGFVPIGRPVANTRVYVLDDHLSPTPIGVMGELYIGGVQVAMGYLKRPELTMEKFIADPFSDDQNDRLYRTGDLCRWRADGNLEFLGRMDNQVKLRGFRIELGEIEAAMDAHPAIAQSVAAIHDDRSGQQIIAYFRLADADEEPTGTVLRSFLRQTLPDYMIPSVFMMVDAFPHLTSGKIDRNALPDLDVDWSSGEVEFREPIDELEKSMAEIWKDLLKCERVGLSDNFFELGGNSLMSVRAILRFEEVWGYRLNPRDMVLQTLEQITEQCRREIADDISVTAGNSVSQKATRKVRGILEWLVSKVRSTT